MELNETTALCRMIGTSQGTYWVKVFGPDTAILAASAQPLALRAALEFADRATEKKYTKHFHWEDAVRIPESQSPPP